MSAIAQRPVAGFGADTFRLVFPAHKSAAYVRDAGYLSVADNAHSYPLHLAAGVGIPGTVLLYALFAWVGIRAARGIFGRRRGKASHMLEARDRRVLLGVWAGCLGYLTSLLFGISVPGTTFVLWTFIGILLAPVAVVSEIRTRRWARAGAACVAAVGIAVIAFAAASLYADHAYSSSVHARSLRTRVDAAGKAAQFDPFNGVYRTHVGLVYMDVFAQAVRQAAQAEAAGQDSEALRTIARRAFLDAATALRGAIEFTPPENDNHVALAALYNLGGNAFRDTAYFEQAMAAAHAGIAVSPLAPALHYQLAWAYSGLNARPRAIEELEYAVALDPGFAEAAIRLAELHADDGNHEKALAVLRSVTGSAATSDSVASATARIEARAARGPSANAR
jgi:Tfp pilus assembly protein PilF